MAQVGPEQLKLLEGTAGELFAQISALGGVRVDDPVVTRAKAETALLLDLGLIRAEDGAYTVVDPQMVQSATVVPLGQRAAQLASETSAWAAAFSELAQTYRRSPTRVDGPLSTLHGIDQIGRFIEECLADAREELLTAQPQTGRTAASLREATSRDVAALERGVQMRTIYQHAARRSRLQRQYVARVTELGAEVRTLDEFFNRLIVIDRRIAIVPSAAGTSVAIVIRDSDLVAYLVDMFERNWDRGRPFTTAGSEPVSEIALEQRAMATRMLIEGHPDSASAKRMGVSERTYAAYLADLKGAYEAETRFQLGYRMGLEAARREAEDGKTAK